MRIPFLKGDQNTGTFVDKLPVNVLAVNHETQGATGFYNSFLGLKLEADGQGIDRGAVYVSREDFKGHYRVSGESLIKVSSGVVTVIGEVTGTDQVSMAYSFNNLAIVADGKLYYYNPTDGLREITDNEVGDPIDICFIDSYFVLTDGEDIYHSNITDEELYETLDFGNAQFIPDASYGLEQTESNEIMSFGAFSIEYFRNAGTENFAFQRVSGKFQKIGILGTHCKAEMDGAYYCLARRKETAPSFYILGVGREQNVSTYSIDVILKKYTDEDLANVVIEAFKYDSMKLVIVHLPNETLLFNVTLAATEGQQNAWSIISTSDMGNAPYRAKNIVIDGAGKYIAGDKNGSSISEVTDEVATHLGEKVGCIIYTPLIPFRAFSIDEIEFITASGFTTDDDTVFTSMTKNGVTYSKEYAMLYDCKSDYDSRFILRRLGFTDYRAGFKFRTLSDSKMSFIALEVTGG